MVLHRCSAGGVEGRKMKKLSIVIANCSQCIWQLHPARSHACGHPEIMVEGKNVSVDGIKPFPDWCPLEDTVPHDIVEPGC